MDNQKHYHSLKPIAFAWLATLIFKLGLLPFLPITPDEAYYFAWGRHLQLSYFDHPPLISWLMYLAQPFWKSAWGIRAVGVVFLHLGMWPWLLGLKNLGLNLRSSLIWLLLIVFGPLTGLGGFVITPDVPLIFFWGVGFYLLSQNHKNPEKIDWLRLGVIFGLGLLSKYTMVLLPITILTFLIWEKKVQVLKKSRPWVGMALALIVFLPVLVWNQKNNWDSIRFQTHHGLGNENIFQFKWTVEYLLAQVGLINPIVFIVAVWAAIRHRKQKLLIAFSFIPLIFFMMTSLRARVEANWPVCAYPALTGLALIGLQNYYSASRKWLAGAGVLSLLFYFGVITHVISPWLPVRPEQDRTVQFRKWNSDLPALEKFHPLFARSYQLAAYYSYFRDKEKEVFKPAGLDRRDFYDYLPQPTSFSGMYLVLNPNDNVSFFLGEKYRLAVVEVLPSGLYLYEIRDK